jgi:ABC-type bacteriocin/lantibiotic exporter with double-glycine peptidase domain
MQHDPLSRRGDALGFAQIQRPAAVLIKDRQVVMGMPGAREFSERLPLGCQMKVGEAGMQLSSGQRPRIAIARPI